MTSLRDALRSLRGQRSFAAVVVLTLAVAIAVNTAIFSVCDQLVFRPVTLADPDSLVAIWFNNPQRNVQSPSISIPRYDELRAEAQSFSSIALSAFDGFTLTGAGDAVQLNTLRVSASFFPTLGVTPARGRNFTAAEDVPNGPAVCLLSHEFWQTQFAGRDSIVGESINLNGAPWVVVGVLPPNLSAPFRQVQLFAPRVFEVTGLTQAQLAGGATFAQPIARLKPGVSIAQATAELAAFSAGYKARHPANIDAQNVTEVRSFVSTLVAGLQPTMYTLLGAVGCVLLIACANVASLFLSRLLRRRKEIALRQSLGASRGAVIAQFQCESLIYSTAAAVLGIGLAVLALKALQAVVAPSLPPNTTLTLNGRALLVTVGLSVATAFLTGFFPALQATRSRLAEDLKDGVRGTSGAAGGRFRQVLTVAEVMMSVVLLVGAALLLVTFAKLRSSALGFEPAGVGAAFVGLSPQRYATPAAQVDFFDRVIEQLVARPDVTSAAVSFALPLSGSPRTPYSVAGRPQPGPGQQPLANMNIVSEDFFKVFQIPLVRGRSFNADDRLSSPLVCIVNQTFASHVFPDQSAIGQGIMVGIGNTRVEIVGVIADVKSAGANAPTPDELYFSARQRPRGGLNISAKTTGDPAALQAAIRDAVAAVDRSQAVAFFATMPATVQLSLGTQQIVATLTGLFAAIALALSITGLYSVLAHLVSQRTNEIGIRMALGATRARVIAGVMQSGLWLVGVGLVLGLAAAAGASQYLQQSLFGVTPLSLPVYAGVALLFLGVAVAACLAPSLRASRIDPLKALRGE